MQCISNDNGEISVSQSYNRGKINMKIDEVSLHQMYFSLYSYTHKLVC